MFPIFARYQHCFDIAPKEALVRTRMCVRLGEFPWAEAHVENEQNAECELHTLSRLIVPVLVEFPQEAEYVIYDRAVG